MMHVPWLLTFASDFRAEAGASAHSHADSVAGARTQPCAHATAH